MAALVLQRANTAPVERAFADFVYDFHERLSNGPYEALVTWKLQSETRFTIKPRERDPKSEFKELSFTLELRNDGGALNMNVLIPNGDVDTADMLHKYIAYLQARLGAQRDMQVVRVFNDATHVSFCCMNPSDGAKGVRGSIMLHLRHLVAGALLVCWRPMSQFWDFCDFLKRTIQDPQANARLMPSLDAAGGGPGQPEPNSRPMPSIGAAGGGPGPAPALNPGKRVAPQDNGQARQVVQKKFDPKVSDVFYGCQTMQECVALLKQLFPGVVDYTFRGDFGRKHRMHRSMLHAFLSHMEALWESENPGSHPLYKSTLELTDRVERAPNLDHVVSEILYPPLRRFSLLSGDFKLLLPSLSVVVENDVLHSKSVAHIDELRRVLKPVFQQSLQDAWDKHIRDNNKKIIMTYKTIPNGVEWVILFGTDRRGPLSKEEFAACQQDSATYIVDRDGNGYAWRIAAKLATSIVFSSARTARIKVIPRMWGERPARLPTTLAYHVSLRCRRDCQGLYPIFTEIDGSGGLGVKMDVHFPYMLHSQHIQSVVTSLMAIVTNDPAELGTGGPGIFEVPAPVPAGDGGPGN